eukprot:284814773_6
MRPDRIFEETAAQISRAKGVKQLIENAIEVGEGGKKNCCIGQSSSQEDTTFSGILRTNVGEPIRSFSANMRESFMPRGGEGGDRHNRLLKVSFFFGSVCLLQVFLVGSAANTQESQFERSFEGGIASRKKRVKKTARQETRVRDSGVRVEERTGSSGRETKGRACHHLHHDYRKCFLSGSENFYLERFGSLSERDYFSKAANGNYKRFSDAECQCGFLSLAEAFSDHLDAGLSFSLSCGYFLYAVRYISPSS